MKPGISSFLNLSRGWAAALVLVSHVRHLILIDLQGVEHRTLVHDALYFVTGFGHESVVIFFVISGYLVGGLTLQRWQSYGMDLSHYFAARIGRIYTVLVPALVVGFALDYIGLHWINDSELYTNSTQYHTISLNFSIQSALDWPTFAGNLLMLQQIVTGCFGSNGPLWSLAYEWWYYCAFALVGVALTRSGGWRVLAVLGVLVMAVLLPAKLVLWGTLWALGIVAFYWVQSERWKPRPALGLVLFVAAMICSRLSHNADNVENPEALLVSFGRDAIVAMAYCFAIASVSILKRALPMDGFHEWLADFSYTTYLCHFPALVFLVATVFQFLGGRLQLQPSAQSISYLFLCIALLYVYAYSLYLLAERRTPLIREQLRRIL